MGFNRKFDKRKEGYKRKEGLSIEQKSFKAEAPKPEKTDEASRMFDFKAFRDLSFHGSIEVKADPNTEIAKGSYPYAILNRTNKVIDARYPGYDNISGNSIVRLQNSVRSQFLNFFDSVCMIKRINYLYAAYEEEVRDLSNNIVIEQSPNVALNIEMVKAYDQALSYGYSTMLTQLPFYTDRVESDLPRVGSFIGKSNDSYDKMGALLHYQIVQQNIVSPLAKYTELLSLEEDLMNMSYRREAPLVQQIFGQLKKKAFVAQLNAVGTTVLGEYFDLNWYKQINTLRHIPSRRANDMNNPLITMVTSHKIPHIKLYAGATDQASVYYNSASKLVYPSASLVDPETFIKSERTNVTLEEIVLNVSKLLDPHYLLTWCRKRTSGSLGVGAITSTSAYYQCIVEYINALNYISSIFVSNMTEIRTFLDKLAQTGMIYWKKGISFDIGTVKPVSLTYNQVTADVLKATLAGAFDVTFDADTLRWTCNTEWNMYTGISEYDRKSGGAFLTFGTRKVNKVDSHGDSIDPTSSTFLIPIIFDDNPVIAGGTFSNHASAMSFAVTRLGFRCELFYYHISNSDLTGDDVLSRLNPLSDSVLSVKAPTWNYSVAPSDATEKAHILSSLHKLLVEVAGYDRIRTSVSTTSKNIDPDLLCFVDLQIEDVSNAMIQYARNYSPFRVSTPNGERTMGFGS